LCSAQRWAKMIMQKMNRKSVYGYFHLKQAAAYSHNLYL